MRLLPSLLLAVATAVAQDTAVSDAHVAAAKAAAGSDFQNLFNFQCYGPGPGGQRTPPGAAPAAGAGRAGAPAAGGAGRGAAPAGGGQAKGGGGGRGGTPDPSTYHREPAKVFDNLYSFAQSEYAVWAITTSEGIIVIDTIFDYSIEDEVVKGMPKLGLDPKNIKYAIVTHPHPDHDGGARYLQEHYGTRVIMSPGDWDVEAKQTRTVPLHDPKRDIEATDGMNLTLGDTTLTIYITPGHTPGTLSVIFPVKDHGTSHLAALWGGVGLNSDKETVALYAKSADRFRSIVKQSGADIILANHTDWDGSKVYLPELAKGPVTPNPYIVGNAKALNFLTVAEQCALSRIN